MDMDLALERIADGSAELAAAAVAIAERLQGIDEDGAHELYVALRSWIGQALRTGRDADELGGWLDVMNMVSVKLSGGWPELSVKLEGFAELLHAEIARTALARNHD